MPPPSLSGFPLLSPPPHPVLGLPFSQQEAAEGGRKVGGEGGAVPCALGKAAGSHTLSTAPLPAATIATPLTWVPFGPYAEKLGLDLVGLEERLV